MSPFSIFQHGDRILLGAAAGAAINGLRKSDSPLGDRIAKGALLGAGLGLAAPTIWSAAERTAPWLAKKTGSGVWSHFSEMPGKFATLRPKVGVGMAAWKSFGTFPAFALAGAATGVATGHGLKGAALGAAAGIGLRGVGGAGEWWTRLGKIPGARTATVLSASTAGVIAAGMGKSDPEFTAEAYPDPTGGSEYYAAQSAENSGLNSSLFSAYDSGIRDRMNRMSASGNMVFGLHGGRH